MTSQKRKTITENSKNTRKIALRSYKSDAKKIEASCNNCGVPVIIGEDFCNLCNIYYPDDCEPIAIDFTNPSSRLYAVVTVDGVEIDSIPVAVATVAPRLTMDDAAYGVEASNLSEAAKAAIYADIINGDTTPFVHFVQAIG